MRYAAGVKMVLAAGLLWSFQALMIRQIGTADTWAVLMWRSLAMIPALSLVLAWKTGGNPWPALRAAGWPGLLGGMCLALSMGGAILAFQSTTVANAAFLLAASPFLAALLGRVILKEPVPVRTRLAIGLAVTGIGVMVGGGLSAGALIGNLAALTSALTFAGFSVALRWSRARDSLPASILGAAIAVVLGAGILAGTGQGLAISPADLFWCAAMGIVTMSGGMVLFTLGSRVVPSAELTLLSNVEVMMAPVWVWLILGETASSATLIGGGIVLCAILFNALSGARHRTWALGRPAGGA